MLNAYQCLSYLLQTACNSVECDYDGGDCSYGVPKIYEKCAQPAHCSRVYGNGDCNAECNNKDCLYDGFECSTHSGDCYPMGGIYCDALYGNGKCDGTCNIPECNWDGTDCSDNQPTQYRLKGTMIVVVMVTPEEFLNKSRTFLRNMGLLLNVVVNIKLDDNNNYMVYPWYHGMNTGSRVKRSVTETWSQSVHRFKRAFIDDSQKATA